MSARAKGQDKSPGITGAHRSRSRVSSDAHPDNAALTAIVDLIPTPAFICDRDDGTIRCVNPLVESFLGVTRNRLVGHSISDFYRDPGERAQFLELLEHESVVNGRQLTALRYDGTERWIEASSRRVVWAGRPAILTTFADIDAVKRAQLASEADRIQTAALAEISAIMARGRPGNEVFIKVSDVVSRLVAFDRIGIALLDPEDDTFSLVYVHGTPVAGREQGTNHTIDDSLNSYATRERVGLILNSEHPEEFLDRFPSLQANLDAGLKSFLTAPMVADGRVVGAISLRSKTICAYTEAELVILERVATLLAPALEQARLYTDLEREARERQILAEIGRVISSSPDVDDVYNRFADLVRQIIPADRVAVTALEEDGEKFVLLFNSGTSITDREPGRRLPTEGSMIGEVTRTRGPLLFHAVDRAQVARNYTTILPLYDAGLRSFLSIPLFVGDRNVGILHFFSETVQQYDRRDILLAESVASQIAGVIASSLLRTAELQAARENAALAEIGRIISSSLDIRGVYEGFARRVNEIVPCDRLVIATFDRDSGTMTDAYVYGVEVPGWAEGTVHDIKETPFEEVLRTRHVQYSDDVTTDFSRDSADREAIQAAGLRSTLMAPLISNGDVIGTINLKCAAPGVYTRRHGELAQRIADQVAGAIANASFYGDLKRVADERRTLATIALAANKDLDLDGVFARAADALRDIVAYDRMSITLFDADDAVLRVAFERGKRHEDFRSGAVVTPAKGDPFVGGAWVWQSGHDTSLHPDGRLRAAVTVPLGSRDRHLGYIRLRSDTGDAYDERSTEMLERVAHSLTPAIQNALEHRQEMRLAQERERSLVLDHENRELQRTNEANSRFLSTVSHELKTPLTSITAFTDILLKNRRGGMTETDLSQLTVIQRNNRRLGNLIGDLLDLSQIDRGGMKLNMTEFDVGELITEVVEGFRPIADAKSQPIVHSAPGRPVRLRADRNRLMQVLTNLLSNASKYSPRDALITVLARRWKNRLYFTTIDCGIGISEEDHKSLFTLFFRADNVNTRAESGTGVGLHIAQTIVELHGGEITVTSSVGEGTTVSFYVPGAFSGTGNTDQGQAAEATIIPWSRLDDLPEPQQAAS